MLECKQDRYIQEALLKCSEDDSAPFMSVIRNDLSDLTCGWLKVKPCPQYEHRTGRKAAEWKYKDREGQTSRGVMTRRVVAASVNKKRERGGDANRMRPAGRTGKRVDDMALLGPLKKLTPAQRLINDENLAKVAVGALNKRRRRDEEVLAEKGRREWKPVASHASHYFLDESRLHVERHKPVERSSDSDSEMISKSSLNYVLGLLVQKLTPSEEIIRYTL